jgi:hypothetical protein
MDKINDGGPAFPATWSNEHNFFVDGGMTLRDYFAAKAMAALILRPGPLVISELDYAYLIADKMIEFRK